MNNIGNRYKLDQPIKTMPHGLLLRGTDLTDNRDVLLYSFEETDATVRQVALRWMEQASRLSDEHFMKMVDFGTENGTLFAVLQPETGGLLSDRLRDIHCDGRQALTHVFELAKVIREVRRNRLRECSVDAENLWIDDNGRLRIINYWSEGNNGRRSVPGLALLLYQLGAKTDIPTSSMREYAYELNRLFADMPDAARERAVSLACKAYEGVCTLSHFQTGLEELLGIGGEKEPLLKPAVPNHKAKATIEPEHNAAEGLHLSASGEPETFPSKVKDRLAEGIKLGIEKSGQTLARISMAIRRTMPEMGKLFRESARVSMAIRRTMPEMGKLFRESARTSMAIRRTMPEIGKLFRESFRFRKWQVFAAAGLSMLVVLLWLALRQQPGQANDAEQRIVPTPDPTAVSLNQTETPKPSASASATPAPTPASTPEQTAKAVEASAKPAADGAQQVKAGVVPDLLSHSKEEAEQMAIAAGLRYSFFMESNAADKGVVFKQDLAPGTAVNNGDRITFWVSKGM